jgi:hypothetical protein
LNDSDIDAPLGGPIHGSATLQVGSANFTANALFIQIDNRDGGVIDSNATLAFDLKGNLAIPGTNPGNPESDPTSPGEADFLIQNQKRAGSSATTGGTIGGNASIQLTAASASIAGLLDAEIDNQNGGHIGGNAAIDVTATNLSGNSLFAQINNSQGSSIGGDATINMNVSGDINTVAGAISAFLNNGGATSSPGSHITGDATIDVRGATGINAGNGAFFAIVNEDAGSGTFGGTIDGNALVHVTADHLSTEALAPSDFNLFGTIHNRGGRIVGNSDVMFDIAGAITTAGTASFDTLNFDDGGVNGGGIIGGHATVNINASALSIDGELLENIQNQGGSIGSNADVTADITGGLLTTASNASFFINNLDGGTIGSDATVNVSAANISAGGSLFTDISNYSGGNIVGNAAINVNATNITANFLTAQIDNSNGGTIGGNATINMNVSGNAGVTNDATIAIYGSDGAAAAAINFNGGSYDAGGTFSAFTDGAGTITFNNASVHADVLKVGALGTNGVLNIGGGTLSADTTLKLYANSSNGTVNFIANVTLTGASSKIIAGDTVKVFDSVVVRIGMSPADIYTNHAHYSSSNGGDGTTTGIFIPSGFIGPAVTTHPGATPPPFDDLPPPGTLTTNGTSSTKVSTKTLSTTSGTTTSTKVSSATLSTTNVTSGKKTGSVINVSDSGQLLSLLDGATPGPNGKVRVSPVTRSRNAAVQGSTRTMAAELHRSVDAKARSGVLASRLQ